MESKKSARTIVLLEGCIILGCVLLDADMVYISYMAIAVILCAALLCIAKIFKQEVRENEAGYGIDGFPPACLGIWHQPKRPNIKKR